MNKKFISLMVLAGFVAVLIFTPQTKVLAQGVDTTIEALQKQITSLLQMIKNLQGQLDALRGQVKPVTPSVPKPTEPERGWDTLSGVLARTGLTSTMWGTHTINVADGKAYAVKAVNDDAQKLLYQYEGQTVTLWGQLQWQNLEGGFWGFVAKKVVLGAADCPLPPVGIKVGYQGDSVKVIQEVLKTDKSIYPEGLVTGYYGPLTAKAVTRFQSQAGLSATGVLDVETKERIEAKLIASRAFSGGALSAIQSTTVEPTLVTCPVSPKPIPIPDRGFKVYSPSAGETWQPGGTYKIAWSQIWPTIQKYGCFSQGEGKPELCIDPPMPGAANTTIAPIGAVRITLHKYISCLYEEGPYRCLMMEPMPYVISEKTENDGVFEWTIPAGLTEGQKGKMLIMVSAVDGGFSGRSAVFVISRNVIPDNKVNVYSPVSGETWYKGRTYEVKWNSPGAYATGGSIAPSVGTVTISLLSPCENSYSLPGQPISACLPPPPYIISQDVPNIGSYKWTIPIDSRDVYDGKKNVIVSINGMSLSGQSGVFTIGTSGSTNLPPVVNGISGPTNLKVGETGTWTVKAYDPENGSLSYSVLWGDEPMPAYEASGMPKATAIQSTAIFTHVYNSVRTYNPIFYVTDNRGLVAKTSMSAVIQ